MKAILAIMALGVAAWCGVASAQPDTGASSDATTLRESPVVLATLASVTPAIDGVLDDAAWQAAPRQTAFTQRSPRDGAAPSEATEVAIVVGADAVYVGARMREPRADIVARLTPRDREVDSDWLMIDLDSRHDGTTAYSFRVNAAGVQYDGVRYDDTKLDADWDAVWQSAVRVDDDGWTAELRIPTSVLRFDDEPTSWGIQLTRYLSRQHETSVWAYAPAAVRGYVSRFGTLAGVEGVRGARHLELRPFALARATLADRALAGHVDAGLDAKLGLSSSLTLDVAINPDFGQVEADQVVLNLTRFETYYPEKRPFFAEGVNLFATPIQMFYSRRIGAERTDDPAQDAQRIWGAAKLVGHATGKLSVGVLEAVTGAEELAMAGAPAMTAAPSTSYLVARARYDAGNASYVGATATALTRLGRADLAALDHDGYAQGLDGQWQSESSAVRVTGHAVVSERVGGGAHQDVETGRACAPSLTCAPIVRADGTQLRPGDVGAGGLVAASYQGAHWFADGSYTAYSPALVLDDVGYLIDFGQHVYDVGAGYEERDGAGVLHAYRVRLGSRARYDWDGVQIGSNQALDARVEYQNFVAQTLQLSWRAPGTWEPYETADGARLERRGLLGLKLGVESDARKSVAVAAELYGRLDPASGEAAWSASAAVAVNPAPQLQLELRPEAGGDHRYLRMIDCVDPRGAACSSDSAMRAYRFAELDDAFLSVTARATYTFTTRLSLQAYAQAFYDRGAYDRYTTATTMGARPFIHLADLVAASPTDDDFRDSSFNASAVVRWELSPGSTLLAIYSHRQLDPARAADDHVLLKLTYFL